jgi:hypothetical protein
LIVQKRAPISDHLAAISQGAFDMPGKCHDHVLDNGLIALKNTATHLYLCSQQPLTFAEATTTYALGNKNFGVGNAFTGPTARSPNGRKVTTVAVTDGTITGGGNASRWAIVDTPNQRLLVDNDLAAPQPVTAGNVFSIPAFDFGIPGV